MLIFIDGCGELYDTNTIEAFWGWNDGATVHATNGRRGGPCIELGNNDDVRVGVPERQEYFIGVAFQTTALPGGNSPLIYVYGNGIHDTLEITPAGGISIERSAGVQIASGGAGKINANVWHYIEWRINVQNSPNGSTTVFIDGEQVIDASGLDTFGPSSGQDIEAVQFSNVNGVGTTRIDDVYILDNSGSAPWNTFLGDSRVDALLPNAAGAHAEFDTTNGSANHHENVDETPPDGDTTYNETNTANDRDVFDYDNLPVVPGGATVWGVMVSAYLNKQDAGPAPFRMLARPTTTNRNGAQQEPATDYKYFHEVWQSDPDDSVQWTESEIDASEFGVEAL